MADYKRMVSYMYQYENGVKRQNVGYARIEARNGECKITMHMQLPGLIDGIFPTYLIYRQNNDMDLIYLGDSILKNQNIDSRLVAEANNIMGSGHALSEMGGILLFLNDNEFFASEWDDNPIVLIDVLEALKTNKKGKEQQEVEKSPEASQAREDNNQAYTLADEKDDSNPVLIKEDKTKQDSQEAKQPDTGQVEKSYQDKVVGDKNIMVNNKAVNEKTYDKKEDSVNNRDKTVREEVEQASMSLEEELSMPVYKLPRGWKTVERREEPRTLRRSTSLEGSGEKAPNACNPNERLFNSFPRVYPFEDNEIFKCVKIEPKDIGLLPASYWVLSNNSFLLHGYYTYQHIILAIIRDGYGDRYLLGVPGVYHNRERFMARMFGFDDFKSIKKRELRHGDFGYWLMTITLE